MRNGVQGLIVSGCTLSALILPTLIARAETPPEKRFAVLVGSGLNDGGKKEVYGDLKYAYQILLKNGYLQDHVYVLAGAGCGQGGAGSGLVRFRDVMASTNVDYSCDLDGDGDNDVPSTPASKENIINLVTGLNGTLDRDSFVHIMITGDGQGYTYNGQPNTELYKSFGCTPVSYATPAVTLEAAKTTCLWDGAFGDAINQLQQYAYVSLHLRFCFSGGWIGNVQGPRRVVVTATDVDHTSNYASGNSEHAQEFLGALDGLWLMPPPNGTDISAAVDVSPTDGNRSILEAQNYTITAMAGRNFPEIPQYWESSPGLGGNLTLKGPIANDTTASDIVLVLDRSGSMGSKDFASEGNQDTRLQIVNKGASYFIAALDPAAPNQVGIVSYDQAATSLVGLTDPVTNNSAVTSALASYVSSGASGTTSIGAGLNAAKSLLPDSSASHRRQAVLLLTDGRQNTAPCVEANGSTGYCPVGSLPTIKKDLFQNVPICSLGIARAKGEVDEKVLENFSTQYIDAQSNDTVLATSMASFTKCASFVNGSQIATDPDGILAADRVSAPAYTYSSAGDSKLTFLASWSTTVDRIGDVRLLVNKPNGDLLVPTGAANSSFGKDWHIQRDRAPASGTWRFQVVRDNTRIVNGFTSDAFSDYEHGVEIVRRQIQRMCPTGCANVLYFEDGRVGTSPSVYAGALAAEVSTGLVSSVESYSSASATAFATALAADHNLLVYVRQMPGIDAEVYDPALNTKLCSTDQRAILTDTRAAQGSGESDANDFHLCSGIYVGGQGYANFGKVSNLDNTMLDADLAIVNRGYDVFSYGIATIPQVYSGVQGAVQLEAGNEYNASVTLPYVGAVQLGSIAATSKDIWFYPPVYCDPGTSCDMPPQQQRTRSLQRWASEVHFTGYAPIVPLQVPTTLGTGMTLSVSAAEFWPPKGIQAAQVWAEVTRPTMDLNNALDNFGCAGQTNPNGDQIYGSGVSISPDAIPTATESYWLNDSGISGDSTPNDRVWSVRIPSLAQLTGTYQVRYYAEFAYVDDAGITRTMHREAMATQYVGDELLGGSTPCPAFGACDNDTTPPTFEAVHDQTVTSCNMASHLVQLKVPTAADNCVTPLVTGRVIASSSAGAVGTLVIGGVATLPLGVHTIRWTAGDGTNSTSVDQKVTVLPGLLTSQQAQIGDRAVVGAVVNAGSALTTIGNDAQTKDILSIAGVRIGDRTNVTGSVWSNGAITLGTGVAPTGGTHPNAGLSLPTVPNLTDVVVPVATGATNMYVNAGTSLPLAPGSYHNLYLNSGGTLLLQPGNYYFETLLINAQSTVMLNPSGQVRVYVRNQLALRSPFVNSDQTPAVAYVGYFGTNSVVLEAPFYGTVVAPNSTLELGTGTARYFAGEYWAKTVTVRPDTFVTCMATGSQGGSSEPLPTCNDGASNLDESDVDCGGSCDTCGNGKRCNTDDDCTSDHCVSGICQNPAPTCSEAVAIDLGAPGNTVRFSNKACLMVRNQYPSWWGTRTMLLQDTTPGNYPVPFTWRNTCAGTAGSGTFTADWQTKTLGATKATCATLIELTGSGSGHISLRYYGG